MAYFVHIIELSNPTEDGFLPQKLPDAYPTIEAAQVAGEADVSRREGKFGKTVFNIVDRSGDAVEVGDRIRVKK